MSVNQYDYAIVCPGKPDKQECLTCRDRKMRIRGHHKGKWATEENSGEWVQRVYVTPPCMAPLLIRREERLSECRTGDGMHTTFHTKLLQLPMEGL
ncbi:hypothetical protein VSS37_10430 [Candidatus Thiothrix sp. Deng01]|uniref:Uncharacterized protein n=1 Tax=Candidatus Thiothrix phosphatis TaxID=3112415 RepID=A0ABU6CX88_9GAMM|nr:hypothetical protein [Candidatus Thiothrix sp. Deng01]MEB4591395.1 hypothetical protein [Candidatus Thiothrix sp. Deng01]